METVTELAIVLFYIFKPTINKLSLAFKSEADFKALKSFVQAANQFTIIMGELALL